MIGLHGVNSVVVIGLGMTGLSVVNYLKRLPLGLTVRVIDTRATAPGADQLPADVELCAGEWNMDWLLGADLVVASPGIALSTPELRKAAEQGIEIVGDIELFARAADAPVVAITGSNGKSTVTALTGEMACLGGVNAGVGGNIGHAALDLLGKGHELYVLELSSFQLETTSSLKLKAAAYLNLSEDHMDRYPGGMADYDNAKQRIFLNAELAVSNEAEIETRPFNDVETVCFGDRNAEYRLGMHEGKTWLFVRNEPVIAGDEVALVGRHNQYNCLAAMALADAAGISRAGQLDAIRSFTGLSHRCQLVARSKGVRWVNDSKATNVASTLAALDGLELDGKLYLLMGGDGKGADFSSLKPALDKLNVALYCFGADGDKFMPLTDTSKRVETMAEAMAEIAGVVKDGDMVLLSPACASFDQFANFMARGDAFAQLAKEYAGLAGQAAGGMQ
ncbi:UDP-N-acetylmuramoyl-L-alanine--D-glutamate ligase [Parasalinivibrio latis]|uniref:UDP-N-acetylmuramoyl-L-alanine--D-glutamate ligase n=1 Tax=Parasalinivibrio latis TaxID=2952610 RepID=UPI0030E4A36B